MCCKYAPKLVPDLCLILVISVNWDLFHAKLNSHYEAWSYKNKKKKYK